MASRLIQKLEMCGKNDLSDSYLAMAYTIENSLISAGAVPGTDYTVLDLYRLAQPFALELFKTTGEMSFDYAAETVI